MSGTGNRLTLVIPALLHSRREIGPAPRLPALERLLARGNREPLPAASTAHRLALLFGLDTTNEWPVGALCRRGAGGAPDDGWWFCAAPAHFFAARDRLRVATVEAIDETEAQALVALFNGHFAADGWRLEALAADRWYLRAPVPQALRTRALDEVVGEDLRGALPEGPDALQCHRFLNEVQMLFHGSVVNARRDERGLSAINGLWFWGGGTLPALSSRFARVWSDDPLARGLGLCSGAEVHPLPAQLPSIVGHAIALVEPATTAAGWHALEEGWFATAADALRAGRLDELAIYADASFACHVTGRALRRWWRFARPLEAYR